MSALAVGDPADERTVVGPVISAAARDAVTAAAATVGRRLAAGPSPVDGPGWYVAPFVACDVDDAHLLERDEVFGPICSMTSVATLDEAIARANRVRHGLVSGLYTTDLDAALLAVDRLEAGMVKVNAPTTGVDFHLPFGGVKLSGAGGKEQGKAALDAFTTSHTISLSPGRG